MKRIYISMFALFGILLFAPQHTFAQYCAGGPSSTADSNTESVTLAGDAATTINYLGCPGSVGTEDATASQSVDVTAGNPFFSAGCHSAPPFRSLFFSIPLADHDDSLSIYQTVDGRAQTT